MAETLPRLLVQQYGDTIPKYNTDSNSVQMLTQHLENHIRLKAAKQELIKNLQRELEQLQADNYHLEMQSNQLEEGTPAETIAYCANALGLAHPSSSYILQKVFNMEAEIVQQHEQICQLEAKKFEYQNIQNVNVQVADFVEDAFQSLSNSESIADRIEKLTDRIKTQLDSLDLEEVQLRKFSLLTKLEQEILKAEKRQE